MMLTIKERNERTNLQSTTSASQVRGHCRNSRNIRKAENNDWDVEGEVISQGVGGVGRSEDTEGGGGRNVQELHLTEGADGTRAAHLRLDDLAHIAEDQVRTRTASSGDGRGNGGLKGSRRSRHGTRWVVADDIASRGGKLIAIGGGGSGDDGGAVVRVRRGDLADETSNR